MLLVLSKFLIVICWFHLTFAIHQYESNNGLRGSRPRNGNKRQPSSAVYSIEHNGGDNQWKPILDLPPNHPPSAVKHRKPKPHHYARLKPSPNVIFTTEYYPKQRLHQSASTNFVANQSLLVSADYIPQHVKGQPAKTKHQQQQQYIPTTHTGTQYEVHEQINEDTSGYDGRFRYPESPVVGKPGTEKHIHHAHYRKGTVLTDGRHLGRPTVRKVRLSATTSRRPY